MSGRVALLSLLLASPVGTVAGQASPDSTLVAEIAQIKAVDVHAHPQPAGAGLEDAAGFEEYLSLLASADPAMWRMDPHHPDYLLAWRELYGYAFNDMQREHVLQLLQAKKTLIRAQGERYPAWVLDHSGIQTQFVFTPTNGPFTLGRGQSPPRFRWVPRADALVFPFDSARPGLRLLLAQAGVEGIPATLAEYKAKVLTATFVRWKREGAIGVKLGLAYIRPLDFAAVSESEARTIYEADHHNAAPAAREYKALQDHLVRFMAAEAGRLGLVVCIHTGKGAGDYFNVAGSNPALLEPLFNDDALRRTQFVIVHGGWPFDKEAGVMLSRPNVYADFSVQPLLRSTRALNATLRAWLEWAPEKVMFGTDAFSDSSTPLANWEEKTWVATRVAREALAGALTGMMEDGQLNHEQAVLIARMVLRDNANRLFNLKDED